MVLNAIRNTEAKEALFAIFFNAEGGMLGNWSIIALGLPYLLGETIEDPLLCSVMSKGPACDNLFSKTLK